ncbi:MAG: N-acetylmuramoyl-L-alanine amidase [Desulfohalobiaceae bacterium]|nr:N-acetylmuramoyl-L-alanine amidase [Desulfohalobiaceae bacterium]
MSDQGLNVMRYMRIAAICLLALLSVQSGPVWATQTPKQAFQSGWKLFHGLLDDPDRAQYRSWWLKTKDHFLQAYTQAPNGPYAPKSLYYLGRTYQELGRRSFLQSDSLKAVDYFQRVALRFPDHSWADDAKLFQARVYLDNLDAPDKAYLALLSIRHSYPEGDQAEKAEAMLRKLDAANAPPPEQAPSPQQEEAVQDSPQASTGPGELLRVRHWSSDDYTRVVLDLDGEEAYSHMLLKPDPSLQKPFYRLVVDVQGTRLSREVPEEIAIEDGILREVRTGQYRNDQTRVVLDVQNIDTYRTFSLDNPYRIVIDVYAPESQDRPSQQAGTPRREDAFSGTLVEQLGLDIQTIMIDPGHGGKDPGAVYGKLYEKTINLRLGKMLGTVLKDKGYQVRYTRTDDRFVPLEERTAMANSKKADLFISLHVNAHKNSRVNGLEVYYLNVASSKDSVRVAARENAVSTKKISDLQVILTDLMLNSKIEESRNLADVVLKKVLESERSFCSLTDHGVRKAPFYVLMGAKMPAVLLEIGYITNSHDRKNLQSKNYLQLMAQGIAQGIQTYQAQINKYAVLGGAKTASD